MSYKFFNLPIFSLSNFHERKVMARNETRILLIAFILLFPLLHMKKDLSANKNKITLHREYRLFAPL